MSYSYTTITTTCDMEQNNLQYYDYYLLDASAGNISITLPVLYDGSYIQLHRIDTTSNTITLLPQSGETLNGTTSVLFPINRYAQCVKIGSNWRIPRISFN